MESFEGKDRRGFKRIRHSEAVRYQHVDPNQFGGCLSKDISESGVRLHLNDFIPLNTEVFMKIELSPGRVLDCSGRVVWVEQVPFAETYQAGLKVDNVTQISPPLDIVN